MIVNEELFRKGFVSQEQYDLARKALESDRTGDFAPGGTTGCHATDYDTDKLNGYYTRAAIEADMWQARVSSSQYPPECDLTGQLPVQIFDQGQRGTCVAQSMTALANAYFGLEVLLSPEYAYAMLKAYEYPAYRNMHKLLLEGKAESKLAKIFSVTPDHVMTPQELISAAGKTSMEDRMLYQMYLELQHALKQGDADKALEILAQFDPQFSGGSSLLNAYEVFQHEGFCSLEELPYSNQVIRGNEGHLPVPEEAVKDAASRIIRDKLQYFTSPGCIDEIKKFLTGRNGKWAPMPVVIAVPVFQSWNCSPFTRRTGWFNMPFSDDELAGYHAMLIAGYCDEPMVAGGGFFIVRNSWSNTWAWDSKYPGHAKIPYAYIENFCSQALSIVKPLNGGKDAPARTVKPHAVNAPRSEMLREQGSASFWRTSDARPSVHIVYRQGLAVDEAKYLAKQLLRDGCSVSVTTAEQTRTGLIGNEEKVGECTHCVVLLSPGMFDSCLDKRINQLNDAMLKEIALAIACGKKIIPVKLEGYIRPQTSRLPEAFRNIDWSGVEMNRLTGFKNCYAQMCGKMKIAPSSGAEGKAVQYIPGVAHMPDLISMLITNSIAFKILLYLKKKGFELLRKRRTQNTEQDDMEELTTALDEGKDCEFDLARGNTVIHCAFSGKTGDAVFSMKGEPDFPGEPGTNAASASNSFYSWLNRLIRRPGSGTNDTSVSAGGNTMMQPEEAEEEFEAGTEIEEEQPREEEQPQPLRDAEEPTPTVAPTQTEAPAADRTEADAETNRDAVRTAGKKQMIEKCTALNGEFIQGLDSNVKQPGSDYCFPDFNFPARYRFLPWQIPVKEVKDRTAIHGDLVKLWCDELVRNGLLEQTDRETAEKLSDFRVYELKNGGISILVISAFPVNWKDGAPAPLSPEWLARLQAFMKDIVGFAERKYCFRASAAGMVVGSPADIPKWKDFQGGADQFMVYCVKPAVPADDEDGNEWKFFFPAGIRGMVWEDFVTHLLPLNLKQLTDSLYRALERMWREELGMLTVKKLHDYWGMDDFLFRKTFQQLRKRDVFKYKKEELLKKDPQTDLFQGIQPFYLTGFWGFASYIFWQYIYQVINTLFMTIGLYVCIGSNASARYKVSTVFVLALTGLISSILIKLHERKPWRK